MYEIVKRGLDIIIGIIGLIISIPIDLAIIIAIKTTSKGKIIFKQQRLGKDGKKITIYKFRTMIENAENKIKQLPKEKQKEYQENYRLENDPRVTKVGKFLRRSNLDELPQLVNVLKGELSLVGPRPVLEEESKKYQEKREKFLSVKPGVTGYWQVNRDKCINYQERMKMELYYVENISFPLDCKIFLKTIGYCSKKFFKLLLQ